MIRINSSRPRPKHYSGIFMMFAAFWGGILKEAVRMKFMDNQPIEAPSAEELGGRTREDRIRKRFPHQVTKYDIRGTLIERYFIALRQFVYGGDYAPLNEILKDERNREYIDPRLARYYQFWRNNPADYLATLIIGNKYKALRCILENLTFSRDIIEDCFEEVLTYGRKKIVFLFLRHYDYLKRKPIETVLTKSFRVCHPPNFYEWCVFNSSFYYKGMMQARLFYLDDMSRDRIILEACRMGNYTFFIWLSKHINLREFSSNTLVYCRYALGDYLGTMIRLKYGTYLSLKNCTCHYPYRGFVPEFENAYAGTYENDMEYFRNNGFIIPRKSCANCKQRIKALEREHKMLEECRSRTKKIENMLGL